MSNTIDECFLDSSNSNECLGNNSKEKLLEMITTLYKLIEKKEEIYTINKTYDKDDLTKIKIYINNLLRHVRFYINQDQANTTVEETAEVAERLAAEFEKAKKAEEEAKKAKIAAEEELKKEENAAKIEILKEELKKAKETAEAAEAEAAEAEAEKAKAKAEAEKAKAAAEKAKAAAEAALNKSRVQLVRLSSPPSSSPPSSSPPLSSPPSSLQSSSSASSQSSSLQSSSQSSASASPQSSSQPQLKSANSITGLKLLENTDTNKNNNNKFIINLIKILNFGFENKINNNNTTNTNQNFNEKINNIVQQNNNIINALYNNEKNTIDIVFSSENTIVKPLFLTDGTIYSNNSDKINNYYTPLFGIDGNNLFQSIINYEQNNKLDNYKLILFMIKFDYIGLNKYHNIYKSNNINSIDYLDKNYNTLNNNKFLKIDNNIYKINKKYYYDYTSDNIQKHIVENVVVKSN
jgi:hypothetical protein